MSDRSSSENSSPRLPSASQVLAICHRLPNPALLFSGASGCSSSIKDSQADQSKPDRFAILGWNPDQQRVATHSDELLQLVQELSSSCTASMKPVGTISRHFTSGWMGYFSYDAGEVIAGLPKENRKEKKSREQNSALPLAEFNHYPMTLFLDLDQDVCRLQVQPGLAEEVIDHNLSTLNQALNHPTENHPETHVRDWRPLWDFETYQMAFNSVIEYLKAGDAYQVNLTMPFACEDDLTECSPKNLLEHFDAPFSCYWRSNALILMSVTPERFLKIADQKIVTSPIKGTAPRGETQQQDDDWKSWLASSEKNQSENLMIVDLLRNDLSRSAKTGTVKVEKLFDIESHRNVHHLVSTISATLNDKTSAIEALINAFPGGSITGAPKRRAMEIIAELEHSPRGLYCGSFGYIDQSGNCDFNILIRSLVATNDGAEIRAGGGIVIDSTAEEEFNELFQKVGQLCRSRF